MNRYRDGLDHMAAHADDEPQLGRGDIILSIILYYPVESLQTE